MCESSARTEKCSASEEEECRQTAEYPSSSELRHLTVPAAKCVAERFYQVQVWLSRQLQSLSFHDPVHTIYDPMEYAAGVYYHFVHRFCQTPKAVLMLGMNPGPWGMAQTGVPSLLSHFLNSGSRMTSCMQINHAGQINCYISFIILSFLTLVSKGIEFHEKVETSCFSCKNILKNYQ